MSAAFTRTPCPVSRDEFRQHAKQMTITINGVSYAAEPKEFSTGSLGWNINGKMSVVINGKPVSCQIGFNLTLANSKELPQS